MKPYSTKTKKVKESKSYLIDNRRLEKAEEIAPRNFVHKEPFTIEKAKMIQKKDIYWWSSAIKDKEKKKEFLKATKELQKKNATAKTPYEIPRGTDIEYLYYKIEKGYTDEQYADHLNSYD